MNPTLETLHEKLTELETAKDIDEHGIHSILVGMRNAEDKTEPLPEWVHELTAFGFSENYEHNPSGWGTYFGPMMIWRTDDGNTVESPSLSKITADTIEYWKRRAGESTNPLLKARYADLVWDFSGRVTGNTPEVGFAEAAIEAYLRIVGEHHLTHDIYGYQKLERALSLALSIGRPDLVQMAKDQLITYERSVGVDDKPGLWGRGFDLLVANKKVALPQVEEDAIIKDLEDRLIRLQNIDPWNCEHAAEKLLRHYRSKGRSEDVRRVVAVLGASFEAAAEKAEPMVAMSWLEHIHQIYMQYGDKPSAERVSKTIRSLGPKVRDNMTSISHKFEIKDEELERYIEQYLQGTLEQAFLLVASRYAERKDKVHKQLIDLAKVAPLQFLCTKQIMDADGRLVATIGSLEDDADGHIANQMSQNMSIAGLFLGAVLERVIGTYGVTAEKLLDHLFQSPIFSDGQRNLLHRGLDFYLSSEYAPAIHLLTPQIEASIRNLLEFTGGAVLKSARSGGFQIKTLDELLRSREVVAAFGEDIAFYLRVLLTDQRGWNIRNDVCHGLFSSEQMNKGVADRIIHVYLVLALLRKNEEATKQYK